MSGKVVVFWNLPSRMFIADCFYPGCTEAALDSDFLLPYVWALEFERRGDAPFVLGNTGLGNG